MLSNAEVASTLELSHSTVSRMRSGDRVASVEVLHRIVELYDADPRQVLAAAAKAAAGNKEPWKQLLRGLFGDSESE